MRMVVQHEWGDVLPSLVVAEPETTATRSASLSDSIVAAWASSALASAGPGTCWAYWVRGGATVGMGVRGRPHVRTSCAAPTGMCRLACAPAVNRWATQPAVEGGVVRAVRVEADGEPAPSPLAVCSRAP